MFNNTVVLLNIFEGHLQVSTDKHVEKKQKEAGRKKLQYIFFSIRLLDQHCQHYISAINCSSLD